MEKTLDDFTASTIIQTSDEGYEILGYSSDDSPQDKESDTIIKMDFQGNIQWKRIFSSQNIFSKFNINFNRIQTSDGGFAYVEKEAGTL